MNSCILGPGAVRELDEAKPLFTAHQTLLDSYRNQSWETALKACDVAEAHAMGLAGAWRVKEPDSTALPMMHVFYELYRERIKEYMASPPNANWDGVYVARFK